MTRHDVGATLARTSGRCPLCDRYISKSRSWIVPLGAPLKLGGYKNGVWFDDERGYTRDRWSGNHVSTHARLWAHEKCYEKEEKARRQERELEPPELFALPRPDGRAGLAVWCRYCDCWHAHGEGLGHRDAHCHKKDSPYKVTGYTLVAPI